jgi:hypothetical protein
MSGIQNEQNFFRQKVNSFLAIILLGSACFWTVVYYFNNKVEAVTGDQNTELLKMLNN